MLFSLRVVLPRSEMGVGVGPADALAVRLRVMLCSGEADSEVDAGFKESLLKPLRPCTVGNQPLLPFLIAAAPSLDKSNAGSRGDGSGGTVSGVAVPGDERERARGLGATCSELRE